jgi:hypothetical protein
MSGSVCVPVHNADANYEDAYSRLSPTTQAYHFCGYQRTEAARVGCLASRLLATHIASRAYGM